MPRVLNFGRKTASLLKILERVKRRKCPTQIIFKDDSRVQTYFAAYCRLWSIVLMPMQNAKK